MIQIRCENIIKNAIEFEFYDTGLGISEQNISKLFKIFGKLDDPNQINNEGTGFGLYITKSLIELLGGQVKVISEIDKYT